MASAWLYRRAVEAGVDLVELLPGADIAAFGEQPALDEPADLRADFAGFVSHGPAAERNRHRHGGRGDDNETDCRGSALGWPLTARTCRERKRRKGQRDRTQLQHSVAAPMVVRGVSIAFA